MSTSQRISDNRRFRLRASRLLLVFLCVASITVQAQFHVLETDNLRLLTYTRSHDFIAKHVARCFENAIGFHRKMYDWTPSEKVTVLLQDFGDYASGGANTVPFNLVGVGIAPFNYAYETMPPIERMTMMMNHELAHIASMDKASPSNRFFRTLFAGKVAPIPEAPLSMLYGYLTSPRWNAPRWYIEGIAVFMETWMNGGLGRALGAYDEMVFRTMVRDGAPLYDVVGLEAEGTKVDFQVGANSYLYGTRFVSYLVLLHGPGKVMQWFRQGSGSSNYFASAFMETFGMSLADTWRGWMEWEQEWQRRNLARVHKHPVTTFRPITSQGLGSVSRAYYEQSTNTLYAAINYPGQTAHIAALDVGTGRLRKLTDIRGAALFYVTSLAFDPDARALFYTTDNNLERDIYVYDLQTGSKRMLLKDARIGDLAFNRADRSLWGVRHDNGYSSIVRIPYPYVDWNTLHVWDYGKDMFDLDVSPDGTLLTGALSDISGRQVLAAMKIETLLHGDSAYRVLFDFDISTPATFAFTGDGRYLFGSSYFTGVSNIVRYGFERNEMEWVTNAESGLFRPVPVSPDSIIAFHFTGTGFVPIMLANTTVRDVSAIHYLGQEVVEKYQELKNWALRFPSPKNVPLDSLIIREGEYHLLSGLNLASLYPVVEGYKDFPAYGLRLNLSEPLMAHRIDATVSYSPNHLIPESERLHASVNYKAWNWRFSAGYNAADFYDLFGPTKTSRSGVSLSLSQASYLIYDEPETMEYSLRGGAYLNLVRLPEYQNVAVRYDRFYSLGGSLNHKYLEKSLGAVEEEKGWAWSLNAPVNFIIGHVFPRVIGEATYGMLLPMNHSSLWFRAAAGKAFGPRMEELANVYFGGFGNNWVDHGSIWRYRNVESFPGLELNDVGGTNFGKVMLEWTLPPIHFHRVGFLALYSNWMRLSLFGSALVTNVDDAEYRRSLIDAGAQFDVRLVFFSSLESTLSFGYAFAFEKLRSPKREFMISLKIL